MYSRQLHLHNLKIVRIKEKKMTDIMCVGMGAEERYITQKKVRIGCKRDLGVDTYNLIHPSYLRIFNGRLSIMSSLVEMIRII